MVKTALYNQIWRWHFYAGVLITPILIVMALTGGIYLLQPQIEDLQYGRLIYAQEAYQGEVDHDAFINNVKRAYPDFSIKKYRPPMAQNENPQILIKNKEGQEYTLFADPENFEIIGRINETWRLTVIAKKIHGGLMAGTIGEIIVELVACWTLIMVITGFYLWWPRGQSIIPRLNKGGRIFWRDLHATLGAVFALWILVIVSAGLPWSVVWGNLLSKGAHQIQEHFPDEVFSARPKSHFTGAEKSLSINTIMEIIEGSDIKHSYEVDYPWGPTGSFVTMPLRHGGDAQEMTYLFIDQYSGEVLKRIDWQDIGKVGQAVAIGIRLHEGRLFGVVNQILNLGVVITLIFMSISGYIMWWKRRPKGKLGAPQKSNKPVVTAPLFILICVLGLVLPLAGGSMVAFWLYDRIRSALGWQDS